MKTKLLVGAVAALLYGGVALAGNKDCPPGYDKKDTQASVDVQAGDQSLSNMEAEPLADDIVGSGQISQDQDLIMDDQFVADENLGVGGAGKEGQGDIVLRCQPVKSGTGPGTGGSPIYQDDSWNQDLGSSNMGSGGSGQSDPLREPPAAPVEPAEPTTSPSGAFTPITDDDDVTVREESDADMRGLTLMVGGGVEGYTGALAPSINPGPAYGVTASIKPSKVLGIELGYSGAVNNLDSPLAGTDGPDLVRNGGQAALTFGLGAAPVQPYVLGGIGFSDYNVRGAGAGAAGFGDDMVGNVPVGAGLRTHIGNFTADLRANYNFLFDQEFAGVDTGLNENGRYSGTLNIGGTF
jgi:hypothetical protein